MIFHVYDSDANGLLDKAVRIPNLPLCFSKLLSELSKRAAKKKENSTFKLHQNHSFLLSFFPAFLLLVLSPFWFRFSFQVSEIQSYWKKEGFFQEIEGIVEQMMMVAHYQQWDTVELEPVSFFFFT